jgi:hypothetical protein
MVALGRHYGCKVETCVPFDPESKGGVEATVKIAKADLVPSQANLLPAYGSFAELEEACAAFCARVNGRVHRETAAVSAGRLAAEREMLHPLPAEPYAWRWAMSGWSAMTRPSDSAQSATPPRPMLSPLRLVVFSRHRSVSITLPSRIRYGVPSPSARSSACARPGARATSTSMTSSRYR